MHKIFILNDLFVKEEYRQKNIAKQLMNYAYEFCKDNNAKKIILKTGIDNQIAQSLYETMGYKTGNDFKYYSLWLDT